MPIGRNAWTGTIVSAVGLDGVMMSHSNLRGPAILSLGSINADFQVRIDEPLEDGLTLMGHDFVRLSGGKAANVAVLARRLGLDAILIGRIGQDDLAEQAMAPLRQEGVDVRHVTCSPGATGVSMIAVPPDGRKSIVLAGNANDRWDGDAVGSMVTAVSEAPEDSVLVVDQEIPAEVVAKALRLAAGRGIRTVLDPSPPDRVERAVLPYVHAMTPNAEEAGRLTGMVVSDAGSAMRAAECMLGWGVRIACVKLPDGGCVAAWKDGRVHIPSPNLHGIDATGAGDAFTATFAVSLLEKGDPAHAACYGVAASSCAVRAYGSQPSYPHRAGIEAILPALRKTMQLHDNPIPEG
jgi:ribokinase